MNKNGGHSMKYGIIGAMDEEIEYIKQHIENKQTYEIANSLFIEGEINGKQVILVKSGIGKVNAAMTTTMLIERFQPTYIINTGSAGGFERGLKVGDVIVGKELVYHDVDVTAFDYKFGQVPKLPPTFKSDEQLVDKAITVLEELNIGYRSGLIATGDSFMSDAERVAQLKKMFPQLLASEMEGTAIAQVCYQYEIPFIVIRSLSDIAGKDAEITFKDFLQLASKNATNIIMKMIR